jgi:hypothetical protein
MRALASNDWDQEPFDDALAFFSPSALIRPSIPRLPISLAKLLQQDCASQASSALTS